jgi:thiol-disulfide isomerase/thioredoxin
MKYLILLLIPFYAFTQASVPDKYWIDDTNFENKIAQVSSFGDNNFETIVIEFWAEFNKENCFAEWNKIKNAKYYRVDIAKAPKAKKKYRIRMAPTLIIFKNGEKQTIFKAGLDLLLPADLAEIQEAINEVNTASSF